MGTDKVHICVRHRHRNICNFRNCVNLSYGIICCLFFTQTPASKDHYFSNIRTGKSVHFTVKEDLGPAHDHAVQTHVVERILPGTSTLLNLDKEHSKVFVGGYPVTFEIQPSVTYSSFDGRMEELVIGDQQVGLWNFVDSVNINTASRDRYVICNYKFIS